MATTIGFEQHCYFVLIQVQAFFSKDFFKWLQFEHQIDIVIKDIVQFLLRNLRKLTVDSK